MSWDVGYAFRPLDVVQQEDRRALNAPALEGVPMLAWEAFDAERALTIVWSNPGRGRAGQPRDDGALALRLYRRHGARDEYAVLRLSRCDLVEGGLAFSQVLGDAWEVHGSGLWQQRHAQWGSALAAALAYSEPGAWQTRRGGGKVMAGLTWTTEGKFSVIGEAWLDRTAYSGADWQRWRKRNSALLAMRAVVPARLLAANLGWNADQLNGANLRRQNVLLRASQTFDDIDIAADVLWQPEDGGRISSVAATWKAGAWRIDASWRHYGGSAGAIARALPVRVNAVLSLQRAF